MSLVSALDENDDLELENNFKNSEKDLEIDFEKRDDGIGFSTQNNNTRKIKCQQVRSVSDASVLMCQRTFEP